MVLDKQVLSGIVLRQQYVRKVCFTVMLFTLHRSNLKEESHERSRSPILHRALRPSLKASSFVRGGHGLFTAFAGTGIGLGGGAACAGGTPGTGPGRFGMGTGPGGTGKPGMPKGGGQNPNGPGVGVGKLLGKLFGQLEKLPAGGCHGLDSPCFENAFEFKRSSS